MNNRDIKQIIPARQVDMGGIYLHQPIPTKGLNRIDPFLLIHHGSLPIEKGQTQENAGVGPHPHRGFAPVTFVFKGDIHHRDSMGHNEIVSAGGTQWMHAGKGVIHSERPSKNMLETGGTNEIIQFWVNTPAKYKMETPYYLPLSAEDTPVIKKEKASIGVVAGVFEGVIGPAKTYSPQTLLRVEAKAGAALSLSIPQSYNTLVYLLDGTIESNNQLAKGKDLIWFENNGTEVSLTVKTDSRFILLSGEPLNEPIASYGPFVMNTSKEIQEAMVDYQSGKMGTLTEVF